jgi:hypothetical protein
MEGKLEFFGPEVLARSIYLSDSDEDEFESLKSGFRQLLPSRHRAGRAILFGLRGITSTGNLKIW